MKPYRIIIAGTRTVEENSEILFDKIANKLSKLNYSDIEIVSGTCKGADTLGENFARLNNIDIKQFPADWDKYGKSAGPIRNREMAKYSTHLIAIWDEKSRGTRDMINIANKYNLQVRLIRY